MYVFATVEFIPQEDITTYELARVMKLFSACSVGLGVLGPVKIGSIDGYTKFILEYNDIVRHFNVVVYGNHKKYWYENGGVVECKNEQRTT